MAMLRASLPRMSEGGFYVVVVGDSASAPVPHSRLVSIEQAAVLMMQRVAAAEAIGTRRVLSFVLGPVRTRFTSSASTGGITADQVGQVAVAASHSTVTGLQIPLHDETEVTAALELAASEPLHHTFAGDP